MVDRNQVQIDAKSLYSNLLSQGFDKKDIARLAAQLLEQVIQDIKDAEPGR